MLSADTAVVQFAPQTYVFCTYMYIKVPYFKPVSMYEIARQFGVPGTIPLCGHKQTKPKFFSSKPRPLVVWQLDEVEGA